MAVPPIDLMKDESPNSKPAGFVHSSREFPNPCNHRHVASRAISYVCVSGAGDSLPDKEELATAHDVGRHPEGADGIRDHVRLYPNKFFTPANLNRCAQIAPRAPRVESLQVDEGLRDG